MAPIPTEAEWLAATEKAREEAEEIDKDAAQNGPPEHPVAQLQGPFEESIIDSNDPAGELYVVHVDALSRRIEILMSKQYERLCGRKWRQKPRERYHPLWKIVAQMSFGMHLLANGLAKSEPEVMKILQGHVDEMDGFLERTTDDLILAEADIRERLNYLKIPLETGRVFDELLEDRNFRYSVMDDTEKIEHINHRSAAAMSDALKDIQKGQEAISALWHYLKKLGKEWTPRPGTFDAVYAAMVGNVEGWHGAFMDLRKHGKGLALVIVQLGAVVTEIQSRAAAASRKEVMNIVSRPRAKSLKVGLFKRSSSLPAVSQTSDKPLPSAPQLVDPAIEAVLPMKIRPEAIPKRSSAQNAGLARHSSSAGRRRTRSFDDGTTDGNRRVSSRQPLENRPGSQGKPAKFVSWVEPSQERPASAQQPEKHAFRGRSRSTGQLREETAEGRRPQSRGVLGSFAQFEKKKPLSEGGRDKTKDQLLLHLKSRKALDALAVPVNKLRSVSPRPSSVRRDWPLSIFRAKSSNCLNSPGESPLSDSESGLNSEAQMEWSKPEDEIPNTHTLRPGPGDSPRIPHIRASLCSTIRELDEDSDDAREERRGGVEEEGEVESILTALPALDPSLARHFDIAISQISTENGVHEISPSPVDRFATEKATDSIQLDAPPSGRTKDAERRTDSAKPADPQPKRLVSHSADILGLSSSRPLRLSSKALQTPIMQTDNDLKSGIAVNVASLTSESLIDFLAGTPPVSPRPDDLESVSSDDDFDLDHLDLDRPSEPKEDTSSRARLGLGIRVGLQCYPEEVSSPPPPGPGGRSMVTPDYSTKYAIESEKRLRPRLGLGISGFSLIPQKRSLKRLFSPTWKSHNSSRDIMVVGSGSESSSMEDIGMAHVDIEQNFHFTGLRKDGKWMMS